jgi:site-specific DNA-methyltransferase (adenine-specific)
MAEPTTQSMLYCGDCIDFLDELDGRRVPLIIADPPDNLGLAYHSYKDKRHDYYQWMELLIRKSMESCDTFYLSYYWSHDLKIKAILERLTRRTSWDVKTFIWRYTFGQYLDNDCGSGFRFVVRIRRITAGHYPDAIRVSSRRMEIGDSRAAGPRVPDDVWDFSRVCGTFNERQEWHPTQHPVDLYDRMIRLSSKPGDAVVDLFAGSGTIFRTTDSRIKIGCEIDPYYCEKMGQTIWTNPTTLLAALSQSVDIYVK